jgi:hypothetical protein
MRGALRPSVILVVVTILGPAMESSGCWLRNPGYRHRGYHREHGR